VVISIYLSAVVMAVIYLLMVAKSTAFGAVPAIALTLPWSPVFTFLIAQAFPKIFDASLIPGIVIIAISAAINGWLIRKVFGAKRPQNR
jgi:hypothetical protein